MQSFRTQSRHIVNPAQERAFALMRARAQAIGAGGVPPDGDPRYIGPPYEWRSGVWNGVPVPLSAPQGPWFSLNTGPIQATEAASIPNIGYLSYDPVNQATGLIGSLDGAVAFLAGSASQLDGGQGWVMWQETSLATPSDTVFCPFEDITTPGRWAWAAQLQTIVAETTTMQIVTVGPSYIVEPAVFPFVYILVNLPSPQGLTIILPTPSQLAENQVFRVKDVGGTATANNIIVVCGDLSVTFDGAGQYAMNKSYQASDMFFNGTNFSVL